MKALVLRSNGLLEIEQRTVAGPPESDSVLIRVAAAGICGSDIPRAFHQGAYHYPLVMGHEFSGVVAETSRDGSVQAGSRVAVYPLIPNPDEAITRIGEYAVSNRYDYFGSRRDGAFQELLYVPASNLFGIPDEVDLEEAAMTEPAAVAYHAVNRPTIEAGMSAAVFGGGPIGNLAAQWLRLRGCDPVIVSEPDQKKRTIALEMGFTVIDPTEQRPIEHLRRHMNQEMGGGADICVEACGLPITFQQAIESVALFGQVVFLGNISDTLELSKPLVSSMLRRELTLYGVWNSKPEPRGSDEWSRVIAALACRKLHIERLISHRIPLEEGPKVFQEMHERTGWFNKVLFVDRDLIARDKDRSPRYEM